MQENTVTKLIQPEEFEDHLTEVLRNGAQRLLAQAVEAEVECFLASHAELELPDGRKRIVRHGHLPERDIQTGIGAVRVKMPRVRDRGEGEKLRFLAAQALAQRVIKHPAQIRAAHQEP